MVKGLFQRTELLLGQETTERIARQRVIIFGVGGVGSWCAEGLVRSGVSQLTIVDSDRVCITNVNRQLMATTKTLGRVKVEALRDRLLEINPTAQITAMQKIYSAETAADFQLETYDYIIDAIDSLEHKCSLILHATSLPVRFFSSMGAALKLDPLAIQVAEFWKVKGCPLARALRKRFKRMQKFPRRKFQCVFSEELLTNKGVNRSCGTSACLCPRNRDAEGDPSLANHEWCSSKAQINGTLCHTTAIFGFILSGLVIQDICRQAQPSAASGR